MGMSQLIRRHHQELLRQEQGTLFKDWGGKITFCLLFPNHYRVGMSNLGFQVVYALLNAHPDVVCERAFLPEPELLEEHRRTNTPLLSLESSRPVNRFHVLAFSLPFENDYPNLLKMLELGRVPLLSAERGPHDPLVVAGGAAVTMNPEPLAPFLDCVLVGEGEELIDDFLHALKRRWDSPREELLKGLAQVDGIYVPSLYKARWNDDGTLREISPLGDFPLKVRRRWLKEMAASAIASSPLVTPHGEFGNTVLIEIGRGCPYRCRFCAVRTVYAPFRLREINALKEAVSKALGLSDRIGILGAAVGSHPRLEELCDHILSSGGRFTLSSIRADKITPGLARALAASGQRTVTLAPETGSESLRRRIAKDLSDEEVFRAVRTLAQEGITNLRFYFMVGLPGEKEDDLKAINTLLGKIRHQLDVILRGKGGKMVISVNPFIPKPWTPFQWHPYAGTKELQLKIRTLKKALPRVKGVRFHHDLPKWGYFQTLFSMGDRRVGWELYRGTKEGDWVKYLRTAAFNPDFWVLRPKGQREKFPFEVIDQGVDRNSLWEEYRKALL